MNRAEYANAIRDLLAVEVDPATILPPDDSLEGLDNLADVLGTSPALIERYAQLLVNRAKATAEYVGKLVSEGAKTAQDNFSKVYSKTA